MIPIQALWLPILLSAILVFFASWVIHMFLPYHKNDFEKLPDEDAVMDSLRAHNLKPGDYYTPMCTGPEAMKDPAYLEKTNKGPVFMMTVMENGPPKMGASLAQWFLYCLLVGILAAYISGQALAPDAHYLKVFQIAGCTAFIGYAIALLQGSIWYKRKWSTTLKGMFDGLIYSLLTAGVFGWLWPGM